MAVHSKPIWTHKVVRNELGRITAVVPDATKAVIVHDAAQLAIRGVGWGKLEQALYEEFGHTNNGKRFRPYHFYHLFHNPYFWGNSARRWRNVAYENGFTWDLWIFDPSAPAPEQALVYYNTHAPYLPADEGAQLKAELLRRRRAVRGSARPHAMKRFSGLLICAECLYRMTFVFNGVRLNYYRCGASIKTRPKKRTCSGNYVREDAIQAWLHRILEEMLVKNDAYRFMRDSGVRLNQDDADSLRARITEIRKQVSRLIEKQAVADDEVASLYEQQIGQRATEIKKLQSRLQQIEKMLKSGERDEADRAFEELRTYPDLAAFWADDDTTVNQILHGLAGKHRLLVRKGEVVRIVSL